MPGVRSGRGAAVLLTLLAVALAACGGTSATARPSMIEAGQVAPSAQVVGGAATGGGAGGTTVPLAKQNPTTALFTALGVFQSCLKGLGVTFVGAPSASNPNSPANDPSYIKSLTTCAAQSNIVQALKTEQTAQENLTPAQVKKENKIYLKWRTCMIGRGWTIPLPKPNSQGALFSFGAGGSGGPQMTPPPGQSLFNSPDIQACLAKSGAGQT